MKKGFLIWSNPDGSKRVADANQSFFIGPPDNYPINGLDHLSSYVSKLFNFSGDFKCLSIFTQNGERGLALHSRNGRLEVVFTVNKEADPEGEDSIRSFFTDLRIQPSKDYLGSNGGRPNATLILVYQLDYGLPETVALVRRILIELCKVQSDGGLLFRYWTKDEKYKGISP